MKTLISADGPFQANVIKGRLESEGIAAEVINEDMGTLFPYSITDDRGIRIIVHEEDYERAMAIITQAYASKQKCPFCGSENTIRTDQNSVRLSWKCSGIFYPDSAKPFHVAAAERTFR